MSQASTAGDNTMTSEEHDQEIEEYIWNLMGRSGLLSEMKSQIAQFVQNNGKTQEKFSVDVSRIQPAILSMIYEYLKWVGMKNTCALLLCESPVPFQTTTILEMSSAGTVPELCTYLSEKSKLNITDKSENNKSVLDDGSSLNKPIVGAGAVPAASSNMNQTFLVAGSTSNVQTNSNTSKTSPEESPQNSLSAGNAQTNPSSGRPASNPSSSGSDCALSNHVINNNTSTVNNNNIPATPQSDSSDSESVNKSSPKEKVYTKQYEKNVSEKKTQNHQQKFVEQELKPCNSDQSLQQQKPKEHMHNYVFMTEKQKMEHLNKKFSGQDLLLRKKTSSDEPLKSPTDNSPSKFNEPEKILDISNPWKKPGAFDPTEFDDESISDLNDSTAEDVTQDLSMDSDSKVIAANVAECEHVMKLK